MDKKIRIECKCGPDITGIMFPCMKRHHFSTLMGISDKMLDIVHITGAADAEPLRFSLAAIPTENNRSEGQAGRCFTKCPYPVNTTLTEVRASERPCSGHPLYARPYSGDEILTRGTCEDAVFETFGRCHQRGKVSVHGAIHRYGVTQMGVGIEKPGAYPEGRSGGSLLDSSDDPLLNDNIGRPECELFPKKSLPGENLYGCHGMP
jgi:hypothetical protein